MPGSGLPAIQLHVFPPTGLAAFACPPATAFLAACITLTCLVAWLLVQQRTAGAPGAIDAMYADLQVRGFLKVSAGRGQATFGFVCPLPALEWGHKVYMDLQVECDVDKNN